MSESRIVIEHKDWHTDIEELVRFVRWYLDGSRETWRCATDIFDEPWHYEDEYQAYLEDKKGQWV